MPLVADAVRDLEPALAAVPALVAALPDADWRRRPGPGAWSILEIVHHLLDEENEDFPRRIRLTLADPAQAWPPIDPPGWVDSRAYNGQEPQAVLAAFLAARRTNLAWLGGQAGADWSRTHGHPKLGPMSAEQLLHAWCAHDLLHLRQLLARRWAMREAAAGALGLAYAGGW